MNSQLISNALSENKNLYKFESAKKIYFARVYNKCFLLEKKNSTSKVISLKSRNVFIYNLKTGLLVFSNEV